MELEEGQFLVMDSDGTFQVCPIKARMETKRPRQYKDRGIRMAKFERAFKSRKVYLSEDLHEYQIMRDKIDREKYKVVFLDNREERIVTAYGAYNVRRY